LNINDDRLKETVRVGRERGETLKDALGAAWRGAAEEWRSAAEEHAFEEGRTSAGRSTGGARERWSNAGWTATSRYTSPRKYPLHVLAAYYRLGLGAGSSLEEVHKKRRELVKRYHPDRFVDSEQRVRAEKLTAEINAAHDVVARHLTREK
jgi:hypothetical protein